MGATQARKQPRPIEYDVEDEDALYNTRMPSSARRYRPSQPIERDVLEEITSQQGTFVQRRSSLRSKQTNGMTSNAVTPPKTDDLPALSRFPLTPVLVGMVAMVVLFMGFTALASWWHVYQDDLHYGRPRTSQLDAVVGHNDSRSNPTHFIFINLNRHVEIIEIPGGDATHSRVYIGPTLLGDGQDLTPVTGEIRDVNHDGKPDLILHIQDQQIIFLNDGTTFHSQ